MMKAMDVYTGKDTKGTKAFDGLWSCRRVNNPSQGLRFRTLQPYGFIIILHHNHHR
jgi:hypothetical protein